MSKSPSRDLSIAELASVVGAGAGSGAKNELQAVKNYMFAGNLRSKLVQRAKYSLGVINYQPYADYIAAAPGGSAYVEDLRRLRPSIPTR